VNVLKPRRQVRFLLRGVSRKGEKREKKRTVPSLTETRGGKGWEKRWKDRQKKDQFRGTKKFQSVEKNKFVGTD